MRHHCFSYCFCTHYKVFNWLAGSLLFLPRKRTSLTQQSMFSIASYPFSFKVLWAPILDAVFLKRFGRRKSWLVPVQILTGVAMIVGSSWLPIALNSDDVAGLTAYFFSLYFLMATQDIAVDGWALKMLSKRNVGLASTCNTIGRRLDTSPRTPDFSLCTPWDMSPCPRS